MIFLTGGLFARCLTAATTLMLASACALQAAPWTDKPQPLVLGLPGQRTVARADAGSSLAMDGGWRTLYCVQGGDLMALAWQKTRFELESLSYSVDAAEVRRCKVLPGSALIVDQPWHTLYYINADRELTSLTAVKGKWKISAVTSARTDMLLGVDEKWHILYTYHEAEREMRALRWDAKAKVWITEVVATNLGKPAQDGAVDTSWHVFYGTFEEAPALERPDLPTPESFDGGFKAWPLVAVWWDGLRWRSVMVDKTGTPQRPAVNSSNHRVFYSRRDEPEAARWFQPNSKPFTTELVGKKKVKVLSQLLPADAVKGYGLYANWQGTETFIDDESWPVDQDRTFYYSGGAASYIYRDNSINGGGRLTIGGGSSWDIGGVSTQPPTLTGPFTPVDCYVPVWSYVSVPRMLRAQTAVLHPRRGELVRQSVFNNASSYQAMREWRKVPHVYKAANGLFFTTSQPLPEGATSHAALGYSTLQSLPGHSAAVQNPDFAALPLIRRTDPSSKVTTSGEKIAVTKKLRPGLRYQNYTSAQHARSRAGGVAIDPASTKVFYTQPQSPTPDASSVWIMIVW